MDAKWKQIKKDLKGLGIRVNTSIKGCCPGCVENDPFKDDEVAIYQLANRWDSEYGGYVYHQNLGDTLLAMKVMAVFNNNKIEWDWDGSNARSIHVKL